MARSGWLEEANCDWKGHAAPITTAFQQALVFLEAAVRCGRIDWFEPFLNSDLALPIALNCSR